jgi:macrolide-specific efflux system membrane fusion protein
MNANFALHSGAAQPSPALQSDVVAPTKASEVRQRQRKGRGRRLIAIIMVVLAIAAGGGAWWLFARQQTVTTPSTVTVTRGNIENAVLASGTLQASALVSVGAQVSGAIKSVAVKLGDTVKTGDTIAEIDSLTQQNALESAQAALTNVEAQRTAQAAQLESVEDALARARQLAEGNLISQADLGAAELAVATGKSQLAGLDAQIEQATLSVRSAQLDLDRTLIVAPTDGTVVAVLVDVGQTVSAAQGAPTIVKIAQLDVMLIEAQISEADVMRVEPGQSVYFTVLGAPDERMDATLLSIEPAPESIATDDGGSSDTAIYYNGIFEVPNPGHRLRIAMTAQVTIVLDAASDVLTLPASVLTTSGPDGRYGVEVYDPQTGSRERRIVTVGLNNKVVAEIVDGLSEGEQVISRRAVAAPAVPASGQPPSMLGGMGPPPGAR